MAKKTVKEFDIEKYARYHKWCADEIGIEQCDVLYWLVQGLISYGWTVEETERFIIYEVMKDPQSTLTVKELSKLPGIIGVSYECDLDREPGFTCAITDLPKLYYWVKKSRSKSNVEQN